MRQKIWRCLQKRPENIDQMGGIFSKGLDSRGTDSERGDASGRCLNEAQEGLGEVSYQEWHGAKIIELQSSCGRTGSGDVTNWADDEGVKGNLGEGEGTNEDYDCQMKE